MRLRAFLMSWRWLRLLVALEAKLAAAEKRKRMPITGVVALACVPCVSGLFGSSPQSISAVGAITDRCYDQAVAPRSPMSEEQVKKQEAMEETTKAEQVKEELNEEELKGVDGGAYYQNFDGSDWHYEDQ